MIVNPKEKIQTTFFYNNLMLILSIFCLVCFITYFNLENSSIAKKSYYDLREDSTYGPIVVKKGQTKICSIRTRMDANNTSVYFSGEVQDEDHESLYEFGKELWHESGYDSEGYWSESDDLLVASLTFSEPGKYYIQFNTDEKRMNQISMTINVKKGSGIPHFIMGIYSLLFVYIFFIIRNRKWVSENLDKLNDVLEEMSDD